MLLRSLVGCPLICFLVLFDVLKFPVVVFLFGPIGLFLFVLKSVGGDIRTEWSFTCSFFKDASLMGCITAWELIKEDML